MTSPGVGLWGKVEGSGGQKSPSGFQGQSPSGGLGAKPGGWGLQPPQKPKKHDV